METAAMTSILVLVLSALFADVPSRGLRLANRLALARGNAGGHTVSGSTCDSLAGGWLAARVTGTFKTNRAILERCQTLIFLASQYAYMRILRVIVDVSPGAKQAMPSFFPF
jgi:hypothetical protein